MTEDTEPSDMEAMRERYGLPENADRVQKYDPKKAQILDEKSETEKEEEKIPEIVVKSEQKPLKSEKNPVKKKPDKPKRSEKTDLKSEEMKENSENGGLDEKSPEFTAAEVESGVIIRNKKPPKYAKPPEIEIEMCGSENAANDRTVDSVDQLANRTSLIILDNAIQLAVKSKMDSQNDDKKRDKKEEKELKKASIENEKQLKKQQKELEKRLKKEEKKKEKEEKSKKKVEKLDKEWEKKERKQLFSRFRSEDKQKKQIMKKTKEFEKMKREKEKEKIKLYGNENPVEVLEASDEEENGEKEVYEKSFVREDDRPYEDIDPNFDELFQKSSENPDLKEVKPQVQEIPSVKTDSDVIEDVVKVEYVEGIKEIGVTYIPSVDGIENENFVEEHEEVLKKKKTKPKSRVSSFKMPKMNALKSKVMDIFPKNKHKVEKNIELQNEESINESPHAFQCKTEIENERTIILNTDLPKSPNTEVKFVSKLNVEPKIDLKPDHEYENVIESEIEVKEITPEMPEIVLSEVQINDIVTDEEEKNIKEEILISTQNIKNKKKKKSKTRAKLDRFKAKAIESLPKMSSFKTRVKDLLPRREPNQKDLEYERYTDSLQWLQKIKLNPGDSIRIVGYINYYYKEGENVKSDQKPISIQFIYKKEVVAADKKSDAADTGFANKSWLLLLLLGIGAGLLGFITPCVYALVPVTVSLFLKRSKTPGEGRRNVLVYALSIILIYTAIGALASIIPKTFWNNLATNWIFNLFLFLMFVIFGVSFLGAFDINLPSSWANKLDSKSNSKSYAGIFFMAFTLVVVSFSCTGNFVASILGLAGGKAGNFGPISGMFGFGFGLAFPFIIFAFFPSLLTVLTKSGGWQNALKVTLGFVELAFALKFLSNVDVAKKPADIRQGSVHRFMGNYIFVARVVLIRKVNF